MKRIGGDIYREIISIENLIAADIFARKDKDCSTIIAKWDQNWSINIAYLHDELREMVYQTGGYFTFMTSKSDQSAKVREISVCLEYRDRIVHQAVIQVLSKYLTTKFTADTYASIPGRGPHLAIDQIKKLMKVKGPLFCLKIDIRKFYPSIDREIMISVLARMIKCRKTLNLLTLIVNSSKSLPIGNLTSQWFGNLYLCELDHRAKENWGANNYFRYCDDVIIIERSAEKLRALEVNIREYLNVSRKLVINKSWSVFEIGEQRGKFKRGLDYLGYVFYRNHTALRKRSKVRWIRKLRRLNSAPESDYDIQAAGSLHGILKHCDSKHLLKSLQNEYSSYFKRLQERKTAKLSIAGPDKEKLENVFPASYTCAGID